ncbi:MAG: hypothetical protein NC078_12520 [Ruminococcus sp.]|nr:hypothetical protein [Ruminococcus sp.]
MNEEILNETAGEKVGDNNGGNASEPEWRWCLVGNICGEHEFGEEHEIRRGTKHFSPGTKVYLYPPYGGMAHENIVAVGIGKQWRKIIEVVIRTKYAENFRCRKCYKPSVLKRMANSGYCRWWGNSDEDEKEVREFAESFNRRKETDPEWQITGH